MLEIRNLCSFYGNIQALYNVSLTIRQGEIIALVGANGAGKSTTLMSICGAITSKTGEVFFNGTPVHNMPSDAIVKLGISQVPEGRLIFQDMTVEENLLLGAFLRRDKAVIKQDMEYFYDLFPILSKRRLQPGGTLSGGEQQLLAISRALMARPKLLLLDEPSLGLAPIIIRQVFEIIKKINKEGTTVFLVEQNASQALNIAHRGYVMENGHITLEDKAENLLSNEDVRKAYLGM